MVQTAREQWGSRLGFLMAAIGSAVGLGNMWRFPYLVAENGGAAFVLLYLAIMLVVGLPLVLAELVVGRGAERVRSARSSTSEVGDGRPWECSSWPRPCWCPPTTP